jgi:hypothetical protein
MVEVADGVTICTAGTGAGVVATVALTSESRAPTKRSALAVREAARAESMCRSSIKGISEIYIVYAQDSLMVRL